MDWQTRQTAILGAATVLAIIATSPAVAQGPPRPSDVAGTWNGRSASIARTGSDFIVRLSNGRGPFAGSYTGGNRISVRFTDDPGCCTGVIAGDVIRWSNGTTWRKDGASVAPALPVVAGTYNRGTANMVRNGNGFIVRLSNGRGPFVGSYTGGNTIRVNFVDDRGCCTGAVVGNQIRWSNGTVWRRD
jgi:hypothetical protein